MVPIDQLKTVNQWLKREDIQEVELYPLMVGTILVPGPIQFPTPGTGYAYFTINNFHHTYYSLLFKAYFSFISNTS